MKPDFNFKQFSIRHDKCAMKVSTDGILLGAWAKPEQSQAILDIGTGTGLLALMMAQQMCANAQVTAVEIDGDAFEQAQQNVSNSPWHNRIKVFHQDVLNWANTAQNKFDHIICNPPYFSDNLLGIDGKRNIARHNNHLSFESLLKAAESIAEQKADFCLILPLSERERFIQACQVCKWNEAEQVEVWNHQGGKPIRFLTRLSMNKTTELRNNQIYTRDKRGSYTDTYKSICRDFYLKF